jgi:2-iminobutanoate/2-iminopropanoate deaminase
MQYHNPSSIAPPLAKYSHGVEAPPNARWLYISGQIGVHQDGTVPEEPIQQARQAWMNMDAILAEAGMGLSDVLRMNAYVTTPEATAAFREIRNEMVGDNPPASTLVQIAALASPGWVVEIECVAAKA